MRMSRRKLLQTTALGAASLSVPAGVAANLSKAHVVIIGGGFAGASCAQTLRTLAPKIQVTLVEPKTTYTACPFSNLVLAGLRPLSAQQFSYTGLSAAGVTVESTYAQDVDAETHSVRLANGKTLRYDRLVMAPGISMDWQAIPGYTEAAAASLPHAWQAGAQTLLLRQQLEAMPDGGVVAISAPSAPYRCPPGPYERASLIASYLKQAKPSSKILILDAKDDFSKKALFMQGWRELYGDMIEWQGASDGASVSRVDAPSKTLFTDFDRVTVDVGNIIAPQKAGAIAQRCGVTNDSGWCPVTPATFESTRLPDIHVIGDAAIANAIPKSAFAANAQAKFCAVQITNLLQGKAPQLTTLINTCYSLVGPEYGISVAGVYQPTQSHWAAVSGAGGVSKLDATPAIRKSEARYAHDWFETFTHQVFG